MIVAEDESIFIYDVKIRSVWAVKGSKPKIFATGSHRKIVFYGAISEDGRQCFRTYPEANSDGFLKYLHALLRRFQKMILFMDKATWHKKEARVKRFLKKHRDHIEVMWFPSGFPEANPIEECWNQGKDDVLGSKFFNSFDEFKKAVITYYRTKRFNLDLYKYLCH
ncbi:transposase [Candidatus Woesearchaeota archaeon]|nr:transposase [Candidatus Woesearchaeota archaeon]